MAKIYIDPGHNCSGADTGAVGFGLKEQDVSVQIGVLLRDMLINSGQTVKMSRDSITDTVSSLSLIHILYKRLKPYTGIHGFELF